MKQEILNKIDHIGIVVSDLDASLQKYNDLFNAKPGMFETIEELNVRIAFLEPDETNNVLTELVERQQELSK